MPHDFKPTGAVARKDDPKGIIPFVDRVFGDAIMGNNPVDEKQKIYVDASQLNRKVYAREGSTSGGSK
jgi:hypothetical protein